MTTKIEVTQDLSFKDKKIDEIVVHPLKFVELVKIWTEARYDMKPETALSRGRIKGQTHFMSGGARIIPEDSDIRSLPVPIARDILAALDIDQGTAGEKVEGTGDGVSSSLVYKLGEPIEMASSKEGDKQTLKIEELEFFAKSYGDIEEVLSADNEMERVVLLLKTVAKPIGIDSLKTLPLWAIDRLSVADGVSIMRNVSPAF